MRRTPATTTASIATGLAVLCVLGAASAQASPTTYARPAAPRLIHTGSAVLDHPLHSSSSSSDVTSASTVGLHFVVSFDTSITENPKAATIEQGIKKDLAALRSLISTPVTVKIAFASVANGLGGAATYYNQEPYTGFRSSLQHQAGPSSADRAALRSLPATATNPVNGGTDVNLTLALLRATGRAALGNSGDHVDSTIMLNTSIMNLSRTGPQDPGKYDLQQVAMHEIVEVLGAGGAGCGLLSGQVGSTDLFRYNASGVRSYTTDPSEKAYFSINSGVTNRGFYNADSGGDYGDWSSALNTQPQVQDAFSTPGIQLNLDSNEKTALDVVGYHLR